MVLEAEADMLQDLGVSSSPHKLGGPFSSACSSARDGQPKAASAGQESAVNNFSQKKGHSKL